MTKTDMVLGFMFSPDFEEVVVIKKQRPWWQKGNFNGVGGKVEEGETPTEAMRREFREETGVEYHNWIDYATIEFSTVNLHCFYATAYHYENVKTMTDEEVHIIRRKDTKYAYIVHNILWLMEMAKSFDISHRKIKYKIKNF